METELYGLDQFGLKNVLKIHRNLPVATLIEHALRRGEGCLAENGALIIHTGSRTGRSPKDKFIVREGSTEKDIDWGTIIIPTEEQIFDRLLPRVFAYMQNKELFMFDGYAGADPHYRLSVRVVSEYAWASLFARTLFIRPNPNQLENFSPGFRIFHVPGFHALGKQDGINSEAFVIIHFAKKIILIGGTGYAGELKKSVFTVMNFLMPKQDIFPMHCAANIGANGDSTLFFGLSGTGKTTLSSDPKRRLIGDDEHCWSDQGIFNIEGGCYAKCIRLNKDDEPHIFRAIQYGSIVENVVFDPETKEIDWNDDSITENTRATYPMNFIPNAVIPGMGEHPKNIVFLTCDAFGVLPPISRLTPEMAMYHFLSGYTAKVAGTEAGIKEPQATFSAEYGEPFFPMHPVRYAEQLRDRINRYQTKCWLVNTGWSGGPYGVGSRMKINYTRNLISDILNCAYDNIEFVPDPVFKVLIPTSCSEGVPKEILFPRNTWQDASKYDEQAKKLASLFINNFKYFEGYVGKEVVAASPVIIV